MNLFGESVHLENQEGDEIIILMSILRSNNSLSDSGELSKEYRERYRRGWGKQ